MLECNSRPFQTEDFTNSSMHGWIADQVAMPAAVSGAVSERHIVISLVMGTANGRTLIRPCRP
jgi:hypothetical protein